MEKQKTLVQDIAATLQAKANCEASGNAEWHRRWSDRLARLERELPHGAGFDRGCAIVGFFCGDDRTIHIVAPFHRMNDDGYYDGWVSFDIYVRAAFDGIDVTLHLNGFGDDDSGLSDYVAETIRR